MDAPIIPKANDLRVVDLVQTGRLRVALFPPQYTKDPVSGELRGAGPGPAFLDIARALADRIGVEVQLLGYQTPDEVIECLNSGACDVAFMGSERAGKVDLSSPILELDYTCLVPAGSTIHRMADVDRPGVRIAAVRNHLSTLALSRILKHAELVTAETPDATFALLCSGNFEAMAQVRPALLDYSTKLPGSRVLADRYGINPGSIVVAKGQAGWLAYINEYVEDAKVLGLMQRAIDRAGLRGVQVAPAGKPKAKKSSVEGTRAV
jgi:polar amino acid transport system substrate-binding protein